MDNNNCIGLKVGSLNTALAFRNGSDGIETKHTRTCIRYPNAVLKGASIKIGDEATEYADAIYPLALGVIGNDKDIEHTTNILALLDIPKNSNIVLASPAVEMLEGKKRLASAVKKVTNYTKLWVFSEGLCASVNVLGSPEPILNSTFFGINMGSTTTEFGCFSEGKIAHLSAHPEFCGNRVDNDILLKLRNTVGDLIISNREIRELKESANIKNPQPFVLKSMTRDGVVEHSVTTEIITPLETFVEGVSELVKREVTGNIKPEVRKAAFDSPLILSGGMVNITGLPELLKKSLSDKLRYDLDVKYTEADNHISPSVGALLLSEEIVKEE